MPEKAVPRIPEDDGHRQKKPEGDPGMSLNSHVICPAKRKKGDRDKKQKVRWHEISIDRYKYVLPCDLSASIATVSEVPVGSVILPSRVVLVMQGSWSGTPVCSSTDDRVFLSGMRVSLGSVSHLDTCAAEKAIWRWDMAGVRIEGVHASPAWRTYRGQRTGKVSVKY